MRLKGLCEPHYYYHYYYVISTYPISPFNDAVSNFVPLWLRWSFFSLLQLWLLCYHLLLLNNVVGQFTAAIIQWCIPVEVARLRLDIGYCQISGGKWPV